MKGTASAPRGVGIRIATVVIGCGLIAPASLPAQDRVGEREERQREERGRGEGQREDGSPAERPPVFSGPQKGEKLSALPLRGVYDEDAGKDLDFVKAAGEKPMVLVFVHELTRPSIGFARLLTDYAHTRREDGLRAGVVWLDDDRSKAEEYLRRARRSLGFRVPVGIALDGAEGPGAWGLNRNVTLTVIVAEKGRVTANFALVQPSDTDLPKVLDEVVKLIGGKAPTIDELRAARESMRERRRPGASERERGERRRPAGEAGAERKEGGGDGGR